MPSRSPQRFQRRSLPPRPTYSGASTASAGGGSDAPAPVQHRSARVVERELAYLKSELLRVAGVSAACGALLVLLVIVDRTR